MIEHKIKNSKGEIVTKNFTPLKAIRAHCLECLEYSQLNVASCTYQICPLFPFREGKDHSTIEALRNAP